MTTADIKSQAMTNFSQGKTGIVEILIFLIEAIMDGVIAYYVTKCLKNLNLSPAVVAQSFQSPGLVQRLYLQFVIFRVCRQVAAQQNVANPYLKYYADIEAALLTSVSTITPDDVQSLRTAA